MSRPGHMADRIAHAAGADAGRAMSLDRIAALLRGKAAGLWQAARHRHPWRGINSGLLARALAASRHPSWALPPRRNGTEFQRLLDDVLLDSFPVGILVADAHGAIVRSNKEARRIWGGRAPTAASIQEYGPHQAWWAETGEPVATADWPLVRAILRGEAAAGDIIRIARADGASGTILKSAAPIRDAHGRMIGAVAVAQDVTKTYAARQHLQAAEAKYRAIVDTAVDAIITIDCHGTVGSFNPAAERTFGYAAAEVTGRNVRMLMPARFAAEHDGYIDSYMRTGRRKVIGIGREVVARRKDGSEFPVELSVAEWRAGGERQFTGLVRDITGRKAAEERLRRQAEQQSAILDALPASVALLDQAGIVVATNERWRGREAANGMGRLAAWVGTDYLALCEAATGAHADAAHEIGRGLRNLLAGTGEPFTLTYRGGAPGKERWFRLTAAPGSRDTRNGVVLMELDITSQRQAEDALRASDERLRELQAEFLHVSRLSELGQMAATLAHELNQPLAAAANYLNGSRRLLDAEDAAARLPVVRDALVRAAKEAVRAGQIIRRMRSFVARGEADKRIEDLRALIEDTNELAALAARQKRIEVRLDLPAQAAPILVDRVQIQQVLRNLVRNAIEAMEGCERRVLTIAARASGADLVEVAVSDTGPGISAEVAGELFQPFVSTKQSGLGLGLSICRTIVEGHGGRIWVEAGAAGGTAIRFTLPVVAETALAGTE